MRLLLDTHIVLWLLSADTRLSTSVKAIVEATEHDRYFSAASVWEIEIKRAAGKLQAPGNLLEVIAPMAITLLRMTAEHATAAARLPPHHADPFDRMLCAQALAQGLTLVTANKALEPYGVPILWRD